MRYKLEFDVTGKETPRGVHFELPPKVVREFQHATKEQRLSMTTVIIEMMQQFTEEYRKKGQPKQMQMY